MGSISSLRTAHRATWKRWPPVLALPDADIRSPLPFISARTLPMLIAVTTPRRLYANCQHNENAVEAWKFQLMAHSRESLLKSALTITSSCVKEMRCLVLQ